MNTPAGFSLNEMVYLFTDEEKQQAGWKKRRLKTFGQGTIYLWIPPKRLLRGGMQR